MGLRLRPISKSDLTGRSKVPVVTDVMDNASTDVSKHTVVSREIFSTVGTPSDEVDLSEYYKRGVINLAIPVVNFVLNGADTENSSDGGILKKLLLKENIRDVIMGRVFFDTTVGKEYDSVKEGKNIQYTGSSGDCNRNILIGGAYVKYLLENFDPVSAMYDLVLDHAYAALPKSVKSEFEKTYGEFAKERVSIVEGQQANAVWVIDKYYAIFPRQLTEEELDLYNKKIRESNLNMLDTKMSRFALLDSALESDCAGMEKFYGLVQESIVVLPIGYRPTIDNRKDPLTKEYNDIVKQNKELLYASKFPNVTVERIYNEYKNLVDKVLTLTVLDRNKYTDNKTEQLVDRLKGKEGFIRDKMQGCRSDYTGRSVIVVNPDLSFDTIGIPEKMYSKMMEYDVVKAYKTDAKNKSDLFADKNRHLRSALAKKCIDGSYVVLGRQPTLYYLGMQGFRVKPIEGNSIQLNPLSTPAFNADFDGDQMHTNAPISKEAKKEVERLMSSTNNIFGPRNGALHTGPRQEILYGLWKASQVSNVNIADYYSKPEKSSYTSNDETDLSRLFDDLINQRVHPAESVQFEGETITAGKLGVLTTLPAQYRKYRIGVMPLTTNSNIPHTVASKKWLEAMLGMIALDCATDKEDTTKKDFVETINRMVKFGFAIARIYPNNLSVLDVPNIKQLLNEFDDEISKREEWYNTGFETEQMFTKFYDTAYSELEDKIKKYLKNTLGGADKANSNGYLEMVDSGARGSMSNIIQLFGMKGRIMKNDVEAFNAIIRHSAANQLSGLEHFVTAYGSRKGIVDKVIKTYEPGYIYRQMSHAVPYMTITNDDCGTDDGIRISYDFVKQFINPDKFGSDESLNNRNVKNIVKPLLKGRYIVGHPNPILTDEEADKFYDMYVASVKDGKLQKKKGILVRSPLKCKNPCCVKCYGIDLCTNRTVVKGTPIGFIAAQAIGEPGTQLIMKTFQSGGIKGDANLTSSFDILSKYLNLNKFQPDNSFSPINYDFISPYEGRIETVKQGNRTKLLKIIGTKDNGEEANLLKQRIYVHDSVKLKDYVHVGDSIQQVQGNLSIKEIMKYRSVDEAQMYLTFKLYDIYIDQVEVNLKHFETLVAGMTLFLCTKGNDFFRAGHFYTIQEYWGNNRSGCKFEKLLKGTKEVGGYREDALSGFMMEKIKENLRRAVFITGFDSLTNPIIRTAFGLNMNIGSDVPGYLEERGR